MILRQIKLSDGCLKCEYCELPLKFATWRLYFLLVISFNWCCFHFIISCRQWSLLIDLTFYYFNSVEWRYAYAVASALHGIKHILRKDFMLQVRIPHIFYYFHFLFFPLLHNKVYRMNRWNFSAALGLRRGEEVYHTFYIWMWL